MKIVVISYDELNKRPTDEEVISDLFKTYNAASDNLKENMGHVLNNQIKSLINGSDKALITYMNTSDTDKRFNLEQFVNDMNPDLLISYNLAGFELSTLTDSVLYNLLNCRQFHFINKTNLPNEKYLEKLLSINLFVFRN